VEAAGLSDAYVAHSWAEWWTRTQRIRTVALIPLEAALLDTGAAPIYQQIAAKALNLQQLGLTCSAIAGRLNVTDKMVAKPIAWLRRVAPHHDGKDATKGQNGSIAE
jgi:hypothetical protein